MTVKPISAEEFDRRFDAGEDMADYIDWSSARRINEPVHVDLPGWMGPELDAAAKRAGLTREALLERWVAAQLAAAA